MTIKQKAYVNLCALCGSKNPQFLIKTCHFGTSRPDFRWGDFFV